MFYSFCRCQLLLPTVFMALQKFQTLPPIKMEFVEDNEVNSPIQTEISEIIPELIFQIAPQEVDISSFSVSVLNLGHNNEPHRLPNSNLLF